MLILPDRVRTREGNAACLYLSIPTHVLLNYVATLVRRMSYYASLDGVHEVVDWDSRARGHPSCHRSRPDEEQPSPHLSLVRPHRAWCETSLQAPDQGWKKQTVLLQACV